MTPSADLWQSGTAPIQGLGLMRLRDGFWGDPDRDPTKLVDTAVDTGANLIDTAEMYGNEEIVGQAIKHRREQLTVCSKFGVYWGRSGRHDDWSVRADAKTVRTAIDGTLHRLGIAELDLYYLHHRSADTPIEETVGAMAELRHAGKIRALGLSNVTIEDIRRAHKVHTISAVQQAWSVSNRDVEAMIPTLTELGIPLIAHSPMEHGALSSDSRPVLASVAARHGAAQSQIALAWVHHQGRFVGTTVVPLPGTGSIKHLRKNVAAASLILSEDDVRALDLYEAQVASKSDE